MDADGQHLAEDLPKIVEAVRAQPEKIVIGVRDLSGLKKARKSRILRLNSNFWTWALTGIWLKDTQSGFRAYPLDAVGRLIFDRTKYDFEIEVLVKANWTGVETMEVPVRVVYGPKSQSHFRPFRDFALVFDLNVRLLFLKFFVPAPLLKNRYLQPEEPGDQLRGTRRFLLDVAAHAFRSPARFALSVGLGSFMGNIPIWGFQMAVAFLTARMLRLSGTVSLVASNISFPAAIPFILYGSLLLGRLVFTGELDTSLPHDEINLALVWDTASEYLVGSLVLATLTGLVGTAAAYLLARLTLMIKGRRS